jgi:hypothetical protein
MKNVTEIIWYPNKEIKATSFPKLEKIMFGVYYQSRYNIIYDRNGKFIKTEKKFKSKINNKVNSFKYSLKKFCSRGICSTRRRRPNNN